MMELYLFRNKFSLHTAASELLRFFFYLSRGLISRKEQRLPAYPTVFAVDTPGVGGIESLLPLLKANSKNTPVLIVATNYICNDVRLQQAVANDDAVHLLNVDRVRPQWRVGGNFVKYLLHLAIRVPALYPVLPSFAYRYLSYLNVACRLFQQAPSSRLVVFNERMLLSAAFAEGARTLGAKTIAIQHGNFVDNYLPIDVDAYLTWGKVHSSWLAARSQCQAVALGCVRLDHMAARQERRGTLPRDRPLRLVFFSQVGAASVPPAWVSTIRKMVYELAAMDNFTVIVKLHPLDSIESWRSEGDGYQRVSFLGGEIKLDQALADADLMSSFYSSVLAEGLLYDLPIIQINPYFPTVPCFPDPSGIPCVSSAAEFQILVEKWLADHSALTSLRLHLRQLREEYFLGVGTASERFWTTVNTIQ